MDDEALACSGTIACLPQKDLIHLVYATDGRKSPAPLLPWQGSPAPELTQIRMQEAREAMAVLGIPEKNLHFLGLPESELTHNQAQLKRALIRLIREIGPDCVLIPFRYDRHPDHLVLNHVFHHARITENSDVEIFEYFVYNRYRLLAGGDIRKFIQADSLLEVEIRPYSELKKRSINCYVSQTTNFFSWQDRPILKSERVDELAKGPEIFLKYDPDRPGAAIFASSGLWIRFVHRFEQFLKLKKEQALSILRLGFNQKKWKSELS